MDGYRIVVIGLGYTGAAIARAAVESGGQVTATSRDPGARAAGPGVQLVAFADAGPAIRTATHLLLTAAPADADPALRAHRESILAAPALRWIGYDSTTGVYGDRSGGWVDETTPPQPGHARSIRRVAAERAWSALAGTRAVDLLRIAGIYGPGRSVLEEIRAGRARRIIKPGQYFGRIHRDDIVQATLAAMRREEPGVRVLNLTDDEPAANADVIEEGARLLGLTLPPAIPYEQAMASMSEIARSFWAENRRVSCVATRAALGLAWKYPSYREGLRAVLAEEGGEGSA